MGTEKVASTIDGKTLKRVDRLVKEHVFPDRSKAIQEAVQDTIDRLEKNRLARESANLDPKNEPAPADEGISEDANEWPEY
ncbi:MAG: CopG family transcriptional regulator [Acidobacteria bacterium]|nr:CopG family transcriptional regulator [Acidobacteriota bacterium]